MAQFVHLHVHSEYSLLDGLSSCRELADRAWRLGMPALALTDHGTMYGAVKFYKACKTAGVKPILGLETYVAHADLKSRDSTTERRPHHLTLLAQNNVGYHNLIRLSTAAQLDGFYYRPRVDKALLAAHSEGLIALSGCGASEVSRLAEAGRMDKAQEAVSWYREVFPGRYFLEIQDHGIQQLEQATKRIISLAQVSGIPLVATNDVHYALQEQAETHDVLLCIQTGKTVNEPNRMRMENDSFYLKSAEEMQALFPNLPKALENTLLVSEMCDVDLEFGHYHLPRFDVPDGLTAEAYLRKLCESGMGERYPEITNEVQRRLEYELDIIHQMGFDTYFLIVWDLCRFARDQAIWWNVRGSGASSIVAYTLGITHLEPLAHGLIFERFLNLGRVTMPDIDLDFPDDQRSQLICYTIEKYGHDQVAQIITFGTMGAKAALRDVGRALDYPLPDVDRIARLVPGGPKVRLDTALEEVPELRESYEEHDHIRRLVDTARGVEGNVRHASTHAAGVIVSDIPLVNYAPLNRPTSGSHSEEIGVITQYEMAELEELGLLKIDFLGLSTLTVMRIACELIKERHGVDLDLTTIPTDDPSIYQLLSRGDVTGVFQVEGQGMRRVLMKMQPDRFEHVVATISLFRPGPMEYIDDYIDRMHGLKPIEYRSPSLEPILNETFGIIVYQEQIIRILTDIAGYSPGDADLVRRAVGKKKKSALVRHRASFVKGAVEHGGLPAETADGIFDDIEYFARYGFNKSHAADYAVLTCQTAYLKANFTVEYMAALLTVERHNTKKVGVLIAECNRIGIRVLPPEMNRSSLDFTVEHLNDGTAAIRFGMGAVKNVGEGPVSTIIDARAKEGAFSDIDAFCRQVDLRQVNRRALESLIKVGVFQQFGTRSQLLPIVDRLIALSAKHHAAQEAGQLSLFGETTGVKLAAEASLIPPLGQAPEVPEKEVLAWEKELVGVYISEHPVSRILVELKDVLTAEAGHLAPESSGQQVVVAGMVQRVRRHMTKKNKEMAFVGLEDLQGGCDVIVFPRVWSRTRHLWQPNRVLVVSGKVDMGRRDEPSILCSWVKTPEEVERPAPAERSGSADEQHARRPGDPHEPCTVRVTVSRCGEQAADLERLRTALGLLAQRSGRDRFTIRLVAPNGRDVELAFPNETTGYCPELLEQLRSSLGASSVEIEPVDGVLQ
jgi:DNA polymerase-3 subunit alpha